MYQYRKLSEQEKIEILEHRQRMQLPWHSPPHFDNINNTYLITASNFNHSLITGFSIQRLISFQTILLDIVDKHTEKIYAWCILPNHYHILIQTEDLNYLIYGLGQMHGRTSRFWNLEDNTPGRKCWYRCADRIIRSERHLYTTVNYIHYNPVKHGYVTKIDQWEFSSAKDFLDMISKEKAIDIWKQYPILDFGKDWDD